MHHAQRGLVLVEGMIAIVIFSIGILGVVGLLAASLKNATAAKYRNEACQLAGQIVGQMWTEDKANAALKSNFASPDGAKFIAWKALAGKTLPGAADYPPTVAIDTDNRVVVTVRWRAPGEEAAHTYELNARIGR